MKNDYEKLILAMEEEVRALKTIHERGLGAFQFYTASATIGFTPDPFITQIEIIVRVAEGEPAPAFVQLQFNWDPLPMTGVEVSADGRTITYRMYDMLDVGATVKALSPSRLSSLEIRRI